MAIRKIITKENELLRKKSREVDEITPRIIMLLDDMKETMYENNGAGLAAPQIGVLRRVIVIDIGEGLIEMINPVIRSSSGAKTDIEACLSVPGYNGEVERPLKVTAEGLDRNGKKIKVKAEGLLAVAFCHEINHLDGILYIDIAKKVYKTEGE